MKASQASTGMTVIFLMKAVSFTMVAPTIIASIQLTQLSLNSLIATKRHLFMIMSALTKAMKMSSIVVTSMIDAKKLE